MKTEFLTNLGISEEIAQQILAEAGRDIEKLKGDAATLREQLTTAQGDLKAANAEIERFKGLDIEGVQKAADEWAEKAKAATARISEMEYETALRDALGSEKFSSEYARKGVFEEIKGKKLPLENGSIIGLADVLKTIKEAQPTAFVNEHEKPPAGVFYGGAGKEPLNTVTKEDFAKMGYIDRLKLKTDNPTLYNNLKG